MLGFSRKVDYALVAMAELAQPDAERCSASTLAAAIDAPEALLRNILKDMTRAGLLLSERGPFGGYIIARQPQRISVLDVIEAVDGPVRLVRCCGEGETPEQHGCSHSPRCRIQRGMRALHAGVMDVLRGVSVAELSGGSVAPDGSDPMGTLTQPALVRLQVDSACGGAGRGHTGARRGAGDGPSADAGDASGDPTPTNTLNPAAHAGPDDLTAAVDHAAASSGQPAATNCQGGF